MQRQSRQPFEFETQLQVGTAGEEYLDSLFADRFIITEPAGAQRNGYDRMFRDRQNLRTKYLVEYKTDHKATTTGNAFIETVSVDTIGKKGWAYSSHADYLIYLVPGHGIWVTKFSALRDAMPEWTRNYQVGSAPNRGYSTHGLLVPLSKLGEISEVFVPLPEASKADTRRD